MTDLHKETDSLGVVEVPPDKLWGGQTQRSLENFSIGHDLIPREMTTAYAILKRAAALANYKGAQRPRSGAPKSHPKSGPLCPVARLKRTRSEMRYGGPIGAEIIRGNPL
jgi:hypothetical protein